MRFFLPLFLQKTMRDMQSRVQEQMREQQRQQKREGEVTIERNPNQRGKDSQKGEYIEFEEVD